MPGFKLNGVENFLGWHRGQLEKAPQYATTRKPDSDSRPFQLSGPLEKLSKRGVQSFGRLVSVCLLPLRAIMRNVLCRRDSDFVFSVADQLHSLEGEVTQVQSPGRACRTPAQAKHR